MKQVKERKRLAKTCGTLITLFLVAVGGMSSLRADDSNEALSASDRGVASLAFPRFRDTSDSGEALRNYPAYLNFVLQIAKDTDPVTAKRLAESYSNLRRRNPEGAARFLRGLRLEMVYKLELMGASARSISTSTPSIRTWVTRYVKDWWEEADEGVFRSLVRR